jgi:Tol biopolymer transport system component
MDLKPGDKLGPYELVSAIGKGGMGEVWMARDPRLGRDVAIKVSGQQFTDRFEREARAVAALNHTNICILHDVGPNYLVMELIEGPTLADRIQEGPIPLKEALVIAKQIAAALEAAHDKNIVHRDLKPANVKIKPDGSVKVLDFGLAKSAEQTELSSDSPTMMSGTHVGMILGTAGYMAPEQARGKKDLDKRADIWAFGVVLYEMLTGKRLFQGEDVTHTLAAVIMQEPDLSAAPAEVLPLLKRCLEKDPKQRLRDIGDWELLWVTERATVAPSQSRLGETHWIGAAAVLAIVAAVGLVGWYRATRPAPLKPLVRLDVDLGAGVSLGSTIGVYAIISPDGARLVYVSQGKLFTRRLDQSRAVELAGTEGAIQPFFSSDGHWVAFFANSKLKKISVEGGAAVDLCSATFPLGGSWGDDGNIIAELTGYGLVRIPAAGGEPTPATELAQGEKMQVWPQVLPGGKAVLFTSSPSITAFDGANIDVVSLAGSPADHRRKTLVLGGTFGRYLPPSNGPAPNGTGHLLYINKGTLFAVAFDPAKLEVRGTPSPVLEAVAYSTRFGFAQFDFSRNGALVYSSGGAAGSNLVTVQWLDTAGKTQPLLAKPALYSTPRLSPDGQRLAVNVATGGGRDLWVSDYKRDIMTRLTFDGASGDAAWTPDGKLLVYWSSSGSGSTISAIRADGAGQPQRLLESKNPIVPFSFSPDSRRLVYFEIDPRTHQDIWTLPLDVSDPDHLKPGKPELFLRTPFLEYEPALSPDGRWVAYMSDESGQTEIYVRPFPGPGGKWQISNGGGVHPSWSRNGRELFYETAPPDNRIMVVEYMANTDSFMPDRPRLWTETRINGLTGSTDSDPAPDGKSIAALMPVDAPETPGAQQTQNHVIFLLNFADELQRKVPVVK